MAKQGIEDIDEFDLPDSYEESESSIKHDEKRHAREVRKELDRRLELRRLRLLLDDNEFDDLE
ncbi:MAG: hypothetical protein H8E21_08605 [Gammaproteobacteria bacterium]|nr:hypothetical protein [Gammaproteobacteria bacterium]